MSEMSDVLTLLGILTLAFCAGIALCGFIVLSMWVVEESAMRFEMWLNARRRRLGKKW